MAIITINSVSLVSTPALNQSINLKYRLASDPDVAGSYIDLGDHAVHTDGTFVPPVVISGLLPDTEYIIWATHLCSNSSITKSVTTVGIPIIPCGSGSTYTGGESFPTEQVITLGAPTGVVTLTFDAISIPDKFIVIFDGVEVINTGYRGGATYQTPLDVALTSRGLPTETITTPGNGTATFNKTTATTTATIKVYAPLSGTAWNYTLSCPV